jgi:hypothetical protein
VFHVSAEDVPGLIAAINTANANGEENTVFLEPGMYNLTAVDNNTTIGLGNPAVQQANGLPAVTSRLALRGAGAEVTIIQRDNNAPGFRIMAVATGGALTLDGLTVRGGDARVSDAAGGGIASEGDVIMTNAIITQNNSGTFASGGGISNLGTMTIIRSTIANNSSLGNDGGGIGNAGTMIIRESTIKNNAGVGGVGGGIGNGGTLLITNSTIARNGAFGPGSGIANLRGTMTLADSTVSGNRANFEGGGIWVFDGAVTLQNTILAKNMSGPIGFETTSDCIGDLTSFGSNLIGVNCGIPLQPSDLTGDPGLGDFIDDGAPGNGRFPLLFGSAAIDAGNNAACQPTDQLDTPRSGPCDIGAIEFYPVVNDLVAVGNLTTDFDPSPVPGGPAGTFRIAAEFINTSNQAIVNPFAEVVELSGGNLLLNADGGAGGVGARLTSSNGSSTSIEAGTSSTFEFLIGLRQQEPFTFLVNMLGEPMTANSLVSKR